MQKHSDWILSPKSIDVSLHLAEPPLWYDPNRVGHCIVQVIDLVGSDETRLSHMQDF
jgi:hypothetical protein